MHKSPNAGNGRFGSMIALVGIALRWCLHNGNSRIPTRNKIAQQVESPYQPKSRLVGHPWMTVWYKQVPYRIAVGYDYYEYAMRPRGDEVRVVQFHKIPGRGTAQSIELPSNVETVWPS